MPKTSQFGRAISRREFVKMLGGAGVALCTSGISTGLAATPAAMRLRAIPGSGEKIGIVGLGTMKAFNVGTSEEERAPLREVIRLHLQAGGTVIDTAPMYVKAERVVGDLLRELSATQKAFIATKVRTEGREKGITQMRESERLLGFGAIDLMQIHSLVDWETQLPTLRHMKASGKYRYIGVTHSRKKAHDRFAEVIARERFDFAQINYSIEERDADKRILPLAADRGMAVLINKPFVKGKLFDRVQGKELPPWAADFDCKSWAQFFLKFVLSHPAVTCVIPATSKPKHLLDNVEAGSGRLPDAKERQKMIAFWHSL